MYTATSSASMRDGLSKHANSRRWPPNTANSGSMWSKSVRVAGGTTSPPLTFSALASRPHAGGGVRGLASKHAPQEVTFDFGGFPGLADLPFRWRSHSRQPRPPSHQRGRVSSKADDFDVRYRDAGETGYDRPAEGGYGGHVDYDLGYDANGWDTNGFRSREAGYLDRHDPGQAGRSGTSRASIGTAVRPGGDHAADGRRSGSRDRALGSRPDGSHARPAGAHQAGARPAARQQGRGAGAPGTGPGASHARPAGAHQAGAHQADAYQARATGAHHDDLDSGPETQAMGWDLDSSGRADFLPPQAPARGRRSSGPGGPARPGGLRGPGRRGRDRSKVKVKGSWWRHWTLRKVLGLLLAIIGGLVVLGAIAVVMVYQETPVPTEAMAATAFSQSVVYSADGTLIGRFGTTNRQMLTYNQLAQGHQSTTNAVPPAEDRNF